MPKPDKKRSRKDDSDSDSGPEDRGPAPKAGASKPKGNPKVEGQEPTWDLGKMKLVKVREFKGRTFIDIREWYVDKSSMDTKPGKKGVSLSVEQFQLLKDFMPEIQAALP